MNFLEMIRQKRELDVKYTEVLQSFGYEDIDIDLHYPSGKDIENFYLKGIDAYFWDKNCGYKLWVSPHALGICTFENIIFVFELFMTFVSKPEYLREFDITKKLPDYLKNNGFNIRQISSHSNKDCISVLIERNEAKYNLWFERWNAEIKRVDFYEVDEDDPIEFPEEETEELKEGFEKILEEVPEINEYEVEISSDWRKIKVIIYWHFIRHNLEIYTYTDDISFEEVTVEDIIRNFLWSLKSDEYPFLDQLEERCFHIIDDSPDDNNHILFAYQRGSQYQINYSSEKKPGDEAFRKTINTSKLTIDFDHMDGHSFERFCAKLLEANGYENVYVTQGSGDQGIDIIAYKDCIKYGIQCKCYSSDIGNKAVQEAFAGQAFYGCHIGVVLTNQHFTKSAIELARKNKIILWDRNKLLELISNSENDLY